MNWQNLKPITLAVSSAMILSACSGGGSSVNNDDTADNTLICPTGTTYHLPSKSCELNNPPTLTVPTTAELNKDIMLALTGGDISQVTRIDWNLGDGTTQTVNKKDNHLETSLKHRYKTAGSQTITATLYDKQGNKLANISQSIQVNDASGALTLPTVTINPDNPVKGATFSVALTGGSNDKFSQAIWEYDGQSKTVQKADLYKSMSIKTDKDQLTIHIILYDNNNNVVGQVNKNIKLLDDPHTSFTLTATGITKCATATENMLDCTLAALGSDWYGLGQDGEAPAGAPMAYELLTGQAETCVKDKVTGLIWEQKTDDGGLRDKDNTYTWYNPDSSKNGGSAGTQNGGACVGSDCDTQAYIQALNAANYCGYNNWRLPKYEELRSIINYGYGRDQPAINIEVFPNTQSKSYWSSSPVVSEVDGVWYVGFSSGGGYYRNKSNSNYIRAVRSE
ncbi:Lcl C-terminal domain-containing protein [Psychrobacter sp. I-STPA10]|uniref:Lcl C-terminal domain-containing protein n=1 Tax=Psychrobacter sp. I-STPA10 TaxID=2585769 RepID=UPI001E40C79E|nr:DUF1566 domain-containing protein [Psychrobacter sp. I-STPA10]